MSGFIIGMILNLLELYNAFYIALAWLSVITFIPVIWVARNKKMKDKVKTLLSIH